MPCDAHELLKKARSVTLKLNLSLEELDPRVREIDRSPKRLSFSVAIAGLLISSSFVMRLPVGPLPVGLPLFGPAGFAAAGILGLWFLIGIRRSGCL